MTNCIKCYERTSNLAICDNCRQQYQAFKAKKAPQHGFKVRKTAAKLEEENLRNNIKTIPTYKRTAKLKIFYCSKCQQAFEASHKRKYCSNECMRIGKAKTLRSYKCGYCNKNFNSKIKRKYCSDTCRKNARENISKTKIIINSIEYERFCKTCNTKFKSIYIKSLYCSLKCKFEFLGRQNIVRAQH